MGSYIRGTILCGHSAAQTKHAIYQAVQGGKRRKNSLEITVFTNFWNAPFEVQWEEEAMLILTTSKYSNFLLWQEVERLDTISPAVSSEHVCGHGDPKSSQSSCNWSIYTRIKHRYLKKKIEMEKKKKIHKQRWGMRSISGTEKRGARYSKLKINGKIVSSTLNME